MMPCQTVISEAPSSLFSGPEINVNVRTQHRSDSFIQDQVSNVRQLQTALRKSLSDLGNARTGTQSNLVQETVLKLRQNIEDELLKLQVIYKINDELRYARSDLTKALQDQGDVNACRMRVSWLEERMARVIGNKQFQVRPPKNAKSDQVTQPPGEADITPLNNQSAAAHDTSGHQPCNQSHNKTSNDRRNTSKERVPDAILDGLVSNTLSKPTSKKRRAKTKNNANITRLQRFGSATTVATQSTNAESVASFHSRGKVFMVEKLGYPDALRPSGEENKNKSRVNLESVGVLDVIAPTELKRVGTEFPVTEGRTSDHVTDVETDQTMACLPDQDDRMESKDDEDITLHDAGPEETTETVPHADILVIDRERSSESVDKEEGITRKPETKSVVIYSPTMEITLGGSNATDSCTNLTRSWVDESQAYWDEEHHRMDFGEHSEAICDMDPLSYHQMGLAKPGCFLNKLEKSDPRELPWRVRRRGSDLQDVHKIALDKLAVHMHEMSEKFYTAAMMSVRPSVVQTFTATKESSIMHSIADVGLNREGNSQTMDLVPSSVKMPAMTDSITLPKQRLGTSCSGRLVYYPNPIPPPQKLPLTRLNKNKEYPKKPDFYSNEEDFSRKPAISIVDQRNLHEETKFSLYKEKPVRSVSSNSTELRLRKMVERDGQKSICEGPAEQKVKSNFNVSQMIAKKKKVPTATLR